VSPKRRESRKRGKSELVRWQAGRDETRSGQQWEGKIGGYRRWIGMKKNRYMKGKDVAQEEETKEGKSKGSPSTKDWDHTQ